MPFTIIRNDITEVKADAIVNTANMFPIVGAGTDSAIHEKAGPELLEAREQIGKIAPGCCAETPAHGLNAKYVLHTVTPIWEDGEHNEATLLRQAYDSALNRAVELKCKTVAFPLLAAGSNGFPRELALKTAINAFTEFLMEHDIDIILVLFNRRAFELAGNLFDGLESYVDENYVAKQTEKEYCAASYSGNRPREYRNEFRARRRGSLKECSVKWEELQTVGMAPSEGVACGGLPDALSDQIRFPVAPTFNQVLNKYVMQHEGKDSTIYGAACMSRQLFNKIINSEDYAPKKSTAIQLAIGLNLNLEQTRELLDSAGYSLTHSDKRDVVVEYFINHKIFNVVEIDIALEKYGLACLGNY